jgi:c-di-AMP phosphodiesterase-like protein
LYKDKRKEVVRMILQNIFALVAVAIISYVYFSSSPQIVTIVGIVILLVWYVAGVIMNTIDSKKVNNVTIESVSSVRQVSIPEVTKPIRLPR